MLLKLNLFYNITDDCHDFKVCILEDLIMFASGHREPNQHISLHPVYRVAVAINFTVLDLVWGRMGLLQLFFGFFFMKRNYGADVRYYSSWSNMWQKLTFPISLLSTGDTMLPFISVMSEYTWSEPKTSAFRLVSSALASWTVKGIDGLLGLFPTM